MALKTMPDINLIKCYFTFNVIGLFLQLFSTEGSYKGPKGDCVVVVGGELVVTTGSFKSSQNEGRTTRTSFISIVELRFSAFNFLTDIWREGVLISTDSPIGKFLDKVLVRTSTMLVLF